MSVFRNPWWWTVVILFTAHQLTQHLPEINIPLANSYLTPFCVAPILLGFWQEEWQPVYRFPRLSWPATAVATVLLAVVFEKIYPLHGDGFQRETVDYVFYALGGVYFYFLVNRRDRRSSPSVPQA
ncbi:hypothetical protein [Lewinella sp. JB7]|uniref:hypothetical protein n=1 Tax=Lewinella sp. JB7 TaxID=2962887 RepID=UPI0020C9C460|nr:hypothetical protein [Lewinella sp. JB7]MCP9235265.1 hypothetical protein [Lewinella sp. JB7]